MCIDCVKATAETKESEPCDDTSGSGIKNSLAKLRRDIWAIRKSISIINHDIVGCLCYANDTTNTLENFVGDIRASIKTK